FLKLPAEPCICAAPAVDALRSRLRLVFVQLPNFSFAVRHPDVLDLDCMLKEPPAFCLICIEPIDGPAFIGKHLLEIANRKSLHLCSGSLIPKAPDAIDIIVLG